MSELNNAMSLICRFNSFRTENFHQNPCKKKQRTTGPVWFKHQFRPWFYQTVKKKEQKIESVPR